MTPDDRKRLLKGIRQNLRKNHSQSKKPLVLIMAEHVFFRDPITKELLPIWRSPSYRWRQHKLLFEQRFIPLIKQTSPFPPPGPPIPDMDWHTSIATIADIRLTEERSQQWEALKQATKDILGITGPDVLVRPHGRSELAAALAGFFPETLTADTASFFVASMPRSLDYDPREFAARCRAYMLHNSDILYVPTYIAEDDFELPEVITLADIGSNDQCLQVDITDCMLHFLRFDRQPDNHQPVVGNCLRCKRLFWLCHNDDKYCSRKCRNDAHNLRRRSRIRKKVQRHASR